MKGQHQKELDHSYVVSSRCSQVVEVPQASRKYSRRSHRLEISISQVAGTAGLGVLTARDNFLQFHVKSGVANGEWQVPRDRCARRDQYVMRGIP